MVAALSARVTGATAQELEELMQECCSQQLVAVRAVGALDDGNGPGSAAVTETMWLGCLLDELRSKLGPVISQLQ